MVASGKAENAQLQYQELMLTRGFESSSDTRLHFGLDSMVVDSLLIVWPDQRYQLLNGPHSNTIKVQQKMHPVHLTIIHSSPKKK